MHTSKPSRLPKLREFWRSRNGNIALTFGLLAVPVMLAVGASIDYARAYNVRSKMQADLDAGLIAAVKEIDSLDEDEIAKKIADWFAAQTDVAMTRYSLTDVSVDTSDQTVSATATATVDTTFMRLANIDKVPVSVTSTAEGAAFKFLDIYIVIDKSASMLLAANPKDQEKLRADSQIRCEFACHAYDPVKNSKDEIIADNYYDYIKNKYGASMRADVAVTAAMEVVDLADEANSAQDHIRVGLYTIGKKATEVYAPHSSFKQVRKRLTDDKYNLTSATSEDASYFDISLKELEKMVGSAGDGSSRSKAKKLVLILTDGVMSERNWVLWMFEPNYNPINWKSSWSNSSKRDIQKLVTPLNPDWCSGMKDNGVTVGVLYTEYLALPSDWGYGDTVGKSIGSSSFESVWGGKIKSDVSPSTTRLDYIPHALEECATSGPLFISASEQDEIESGLSDLLQQYLNSVRLTQ